MREAIASRVLHCQLKGKDEEVLIRFGHPEEENGYYVCEYEISIVGKSEAYHICGLDSVQALQMAMFMVGSTLKAMNGTSNWSLNGEPHTGFPNSVWDWG